MKTVLALFCCIVITAATVSNEFKAFKAKYNNVYRNEAEVIVTYTIQIEMISKSYCK